jgi:hypothetical protein
MSKVSAQRRIRAAWETYLRRQAEAETLTLQAEKAA